MNIIKVLLFTDLHLGGKKYNTIEDEISSYDYFFDQIKSIILQHKINLTIFLGDMFDSVSLLDLPTIIYLKDKLNELSQYSKFIILSGNHDQKESNRQYQLVSILSNDRINVISSSYYHYFSSLNIGFLFISYMSNNQIYSMISKLSTTNNIINDSATNFLFGHFALYPESYPLYNLYNAISYNKTDNFFSKFKYIFLGHVHSISMFRNVSYIGSCTYHNFQDSAIYSDDEFYFQPRYGYVLDINKSKTQIEPIEIMQNEYFLTLYSNKIYDEKYKNAFTKVINDNKNINCRLILNDMNDYSDFINDIKSHSNVKSIKLESNVKLSTLFNLDLPLNNNDEEIEFDSKKMIIDNINNTNLVNDNLKKKILNELDNLYMKVQG